VKRKVRAVDLNPNVGSKLKFTVKVKNQSGKPKDYDTCGASKHHAYSKLSLKI